jgi:raffinose/stachyose/melibiose transport system substrate-binding protein
MKRTRPGVALVVASGLTLALAACGGGSSSSSASGTSSGDSGSGTVTWWGWTPDTPVAQKYIAEFNKVHPGITVKYTNYENADYAPTMSTAFQTNKGPDIFDVSAGGNVGGKQLWGDYAMDLAPVGEQALGAGWKDMSWRSLWVASPRASSGSTRTCSTRTTCPPS